MQIKNLQLKRVLRTALLVLLLGAVGMTKGYAYDFSAVCSTGQTLYYNITDATNHYVTVVSPENDILLPWNGYMMPTGNLVIPEIVTRNGVDYSVTAIGNYAFSRCSGLTDLTIGNSVTSIGYRAFFSCIGLTDLTIGNSVTSIGNSAFCWCSGLAVVNWNAVNVTSYPTYTSDYPFQNCSNLTTVVFGNQVQRIPGQAFYNCIGLTDLTIGNSVTSIGYEAFSGCSGLTMVNWNAVSVASYPNSTSSHPFTNCTNLTTVVFSDQVQTIPNSAFAGCSGLTDLTIGSSVTSIGYSAFYNCSGLTTVYWDAVNVTSYPGFSSDRPFTNCTNLTTVVFGDQVQTIPDYAFSGCNGLTNLTIGNSVTFIGERAFYHCSALTDLTIPNSVTSIGYEAFSGCSGLTDLTIPNSVTSIGELAFEYCSGLTTVNWNAVDVTSSYSAFRYCTNLTTVVFGNLVQIIPNNAFYSASSITNLTIGNSVTSIGSNAFSGCSGLESVHYTGDIAQWCNIQFETSFSNPLRYAHNLYINGELVTNLVIPESVTEIKEYAFCGCSCLTSLTIPNAVTSIGYMAFFSCSGLTDLTMGNSVTSIGEEAFYNCSGLTGTLTIPNSVISIGDEAFRKCSGLIDLTIGNSVTSIGNQAFSGCSGLTDLTIGNSVTSIGDAFSGCSGLETVHYTGDIAQWCNIQFDFSNPLRYAHNLYINGELVTNLVIPESVTEIKNYAFCGCSCLTSLTISNAVTSIGYMAFFSCSGLTDLTIGNSVTTIGNEAFENCSGLTTVNWNAVNVTSYPSVTYYRPFVNCTNLTTVVFGDQVQTIPAYAFCYCSGLTALTIGNSVTSIGNYAFYNCNGLEAVYYTGDIAQWCNIEFGNSSSNPLCYTHNLYIDEELVTDLVIPESVIEIKNFAFYNCSGLTGTLAIPNSVTSIGNSAFYGCSGLAGILNIGSSVATMGDYAFSNCTGITAIRLHCPAPPTIAGNTFNNMDKSIPVFVACGTQEAYMSADYWPEFTVINESPYNLIITQNDPYGGEISVVHYADCEDNHCAILAINNIGYNFIGWFVNDYFSTDSPYCDFSLIDNVTFEARFERKPNHLITIVTSTSNTWSDPDTWDTGEVPSSTSTVAIYKEIIVDVDAEVSELGVYEDNFITISPDVTLTVTDTLESDKVASIVIEDGGQLIHSNDGAMATVKKTIQPYTNDNDGWNLLSYPLTGNGTVASIGNMLNNEYDLYSYDEPTQYWINQKEEDNGFTALEAGKGYLYANKGTGIGAAGTKIGTGTLTMSYSPFYTNYEYSIAENLFLATELEAAGLPTTALGGLCWYATNQTGYLQSNISIWMANVNDEVLTNTSHNVSEMTLVYTGDMTPVVGWNAFVFNENNFTWDGTSNVLVCVQRNNGTYNSTVYWQAHNPGFAATSYKYNYSSAYDMTSETYSMNVSSTLRPNTIFQTLEQVGEYEYYEPITMSFAGEIENGAAMVNVPLSFTESAGNLKGFNLVGNPFVHNVTSYASTNVAEGCFRLNETRDNLIVSEVSETLPLKPAEGFFVKATDVGASITFNLGRSRGENERKGFVNLELMENGKLVDRLIVKREGEPLEKLMLKGNGTRLYALQDRQEIAIVPCEGDEQAVCFKADENGSYTINVSVNGFELDYLHLIDNLTGNDVNLLVEPSYSFEAKTTDYASRFKLVFATGSSEDPEGDSFAFFNSSGNLTIYGIEGEATLQVVDVLGRILSSDTFSGNYEKQLGGAPGVYVIRLINGDNVRTQKIVVR